jgi:hypothetical protein
MREHGRQRIRDRSCHAVLLLLPLAGALDHGAQIADRDLEGEVESSEHDGEEDPPAGQGSDEEEGTSRDLHPACIGHLARVGRGGREGCRVVPVGGGEEGEGQREREEDDHEGYVGSERADQVHQAQETHEEQEEPEGGGESRGVDTGRFGVACWGVQSVGEVEWLESRGEGEPEGAEGDEDDEWEGVAENELEESTHHHEQTAEEVICAAEEAALDLSLWVTRTPDGATEAETTYIPAAPLPPAPRQPMRSHERGDKLRRKPRRALHEISVVSELRTR